MFILIIRLFLLFLIYSFIGWVCESTYCSIFEHKFVNRGFLTGPICPVYGFGALAVIGLLMPLRDNLPLLFVAGTIITTVLEYITAFLLEKLFHMKWWDYSRYKFNLHGRVCLLNSIEFGILSVIAVKLLHPAIKGLVDNIPSLAVTLLGCSLAALLLTDCAITVHTITQFNGRLSQLTVLLDEIKSKTETYRTLAQQNFSAKLEHLMEHENTRIVEARETLERLKTKADMLEARNKLLLRRLLAAFPDMTSVKHQPMLERIRQAIKNKK